MREDGFSKLGTKARYAMLVHSILWFVVVAIVLAIIRLIMFYFNLPEKVYMIANYITGIILVFVFLNIILRPTIEYNYYSFKLDNDEVVVLSGVFLKRKVVIPIKRIQQISINQGPVLNMFNLCEINITTAGSISDIKYFPSDKADEMIVKIRQKVNEYVANHDGK